MAVFDSIMSPADIAVIKISALGAAASSTEQAIGRDKVFSIIGTQTIHVKYGNTGMGAAAATDGLTAANVKEVYKMPRNKTHIRVFNSGGSAADIYIQILSPTA